MANGQKFGVERQLVPLAQAEYRMAAGGSATFFSIWSICRFHNHSCIVLVESRPDDYAGPLCVSGPYVI